MDPILETIVWGVVWFFAGSIGAVLIYFLWIGIGLLVATSTNTEWPAVAAIPLGWLSAVAWQIFVIIQVIIHIVTLIQLIAAGA